MHLPKPSENGDFVPPPSGTFPAVCTRFIDIGTQQTTYQGQTKHQRKIVLTWELMDNDNKMEDGRPFTISSRYTWSMHEKSTLRKLLENWRGKKFQESDFGEGGFDIKNIVGKPCFVTVVHNDKGDKTYANVGGVVSIPKNYEVGKPANDLVYFALTPDRFDPNVLAKLSENLQHTIKTSPEYSELTGKRERGMDNEAPDDLPEQIGNDLNDEIPF